jgi:hypothetical protein
MNVNDALVNPSNQTLRRGFAPSLDKEILKFFFVVELS